MSLLTTSRILFLVFLVNEAIVFVRMPADERQRLTLPPLSPLMFILLFVPLFAALDLPPWLGGLALGVQGIGLLLELLAETQMMRAGSFSVTANTPQQLQTTGMYRYLENPIYIGILLQVLGWSIWMPLVLVALLLQYLGIRRMVREERQYLAAANYTHRGLDSFLWN